MSLTADGEFFKCDMCGVYFHMNIFCSHRRQCKGLDSQEMKKELIAEVWSDLDKKQRDRVRKLAGLANDQTYHEDVAPRAVAGKTKAEQELRRAPLDKQQTLLTRARNAEWQRKMFDEEDAEAERKLAELPDDILDGFE
ncbi:hypothetical protein DIPPA_21212 [Diplonema papillatum]|nr:hypothetical protein DIPPA_21212 [Diplonema papillatum]